MTRELSNTLEKGFQGMSHPDAESAGEALRQYQADVRSHADAGDISREVLGGMISPDDQSLHQRLGEAVSGLLEAITYTKHDGTEVVMFQDGSSMVVIDPAGKIRAYFDAPLEDPEKSDHLRVASYGPHLKWGLLNAGLSHVSHAQTGQDIDTEEGYAAATRAAKALPADKSHKDHDYASLPHLGSAVVGEGEDRFYASTSGMLLRQEVIDDLINGPEDNPLVRVAKAANNSAEVIDDFQGNILIGSIETMFSKAALEVALGRKTLEQSVEEWDLSSIVEQDAVGINVH